MSKPLVGSRREARRLLEYVAADDWQAQDRVEKKMTSEGWEFIGAGCYRSAFLSPSGVVYKAEGLEYSDSNREEITRARALAKAKLSEDIVIPRVTGFNFRGSRADRNFITTIVAMEYMIGEHPPGCYFDSWDARTYCECGEIEYNEKGEPNQTYCSYSNLYARLRKELDSADIHNENVIELYDGRFAVIDLQM